MPALSHFALFCVQGFPGAPGINGTDGIPGERGGKGVPGMKGDIGDPGEQGRKGTPVSSEPNKPGLGSVVDLGVVHWVSSHTHTASWEASCQQALSAWLGSHQIFDSCNASKYFSKIRYHIKNVHHSDAPFKRVDSVNCLAIKWVITGFQGMGVVF